MKILFIYTNINGYHDDCYSIGLASIVSVAKRGGHDVKVIIVRKEEQYADVLNVVKHFGPSVVGFTSVSSQFDFVKRLSSMIKQADPSITSVCGGVHPTIIPECIMEADSLDAVFVGESEASFMEFLTTAGAGKSYRDIDNIAYRSGDKCIVNRLKPLLSNLDGLPYPDKGSYPYHETLTASGYAPFFFSRGCPYMCSYCSNHAIRKKLE